MLRRQFATNRRGRGDDLSPEQAAKVLELLKADFATSYGHYKDFLDIDLARELARIGLSVANYTQWYWKIDLHNLLHFLGLRLDAHAQYEIRVFGEAIARILKDAVPISYEAFEDYQLHSTKLSRPEIEFITAQNKKSTAWPLTEEAAREMILAAFSNKRETDEFVEKLKGMGFIK